jgi:hypothetical protein
MNTESVTSPFGKSLMLSLISAFVIAMGLTTNGYAQDGDPGIWPERSAAMANSIRVLGWNLDPLTEYEFVMALPDGSIEIGGIATTSEDGDLLIDDGDAVGDPLHYAVGDVLGVYEVRAYVFPWTGDPNEAPVAATTFFHNNFGNHF